MEGFSDGVFGFAATLLVLDLSLRPPGTPPQQLLLLHAWPGYLAYVFLPFRTGGPVRPVATFHDDPGWPGAGIILPG